MVTDSFLLVVETWAMLIHLPGDRTEWGLSLGLRDWLQGRFQGRCTEDGVLLEAV